jgi:17beta-estradiol 17-dehydrogenase / very-long-chain 3-oxoacyl-CoA reductase
MAFNFNCNSVHEALDKAVDCWNSVPQQAQWALAGIGALYVARRALSFLQLFLNCFILSGTNVRLSRVPHLNICSGAL